MGHLSAGTAKTLLRPSFLIACAVLGVAGFVVSPTIGGGKVKEALALKRPLGQINKEGFGPYRFLTRNSLPSAMVDSLGTEEYIDWQFEDSSIADAQNPLRYVRLFVTYYTGGRDMVPHTPDQCYVGGGYQPIVTGNLDVTVPSLKEPSIPVRALTFQKSAVHGRETPTVVYTFHCNGDFVCTRDDVRNLVNSLFGKYAYFSKIEVVFGSRNSRPTFPTREESIQATVKFLDHALPLMLRDHFPDWEAANNEKEVVAAAATN